MILSVRNVKPGIIPEKVLSIVKSAENAQKTITCYMYAHFTIIRDANHAKRGDITLKKKTSV
jgi:hypothetical protein